MTILIGALLVPFAYAAPDLQPPVIVDESVSQEAQWIRCKYLYRHVGPAKENAVEYSPEFQAAAREVWEASNKGKNNVEAGVFLDGALRPSGLFVSNTDYALKAKLPQGAKIFIHSHPNAASPHPSPKDIKTAHDAGITVYVVSKSGLEYVTKDGEQGRVFGNLSWLY